MGMTPQYFPPSLHLVPTMPCVSGVRRRVVEGSGVGRVLRIPSLHVLVILQVGTDSWWSNTKIVKSYWHADL